MVAVRLTCFQKPLVEERKKASYDALCFKVQKCPLSKCCKVLTSAVTRLCARLFRLLSYSFDMGFGLMWFGFGTLGHRSYIFERPFKRNTFVSMEDIYA